MDNNNNTKMMVLCIKTINLARAVQYFVIIFVILANYGADFC